MEVSTVRAGVLEIAYLEYGSPDGWPCIIGHGFPYDVYAYAEAAAAGAGGRARAGAMAAWLRADALPR